MNAPSYKTECEGLKHELRELREKMASEADVKVQLYTAGNGASVAHVVVEGVQKFAIGMKNGVLVSVPL